MLDKTKSLLRRLRLRMSSLSVVLIAALPDILNALGVIDLKSLLGPWIGDQRTAMLLVVLAFMRPMVYRTKEAC